MKGQEWVLPVHEQCLGAGMGRAMLVPSWRPALCLRMVPLVCWKSILILLGGQRPEVFGQCSKAHGGTPGNSAVQGQVLGWWSLRVPSNSVYSVVPACYFASVICYELIHSQWKAQHLKQGLVERCCQLDSKHSDQTKGRYSLPKITCAYKAWTCIGPNLLLCFTAGKVITSSGSGFGTGLCLCGTRARSPGTPTSTFLKFDHCSECGLWFSVGLWGCHIFIQGELMVFFLPTGLESWRRQRRSVATKTEKLRVC